MLRVVFLMGAVAIGALGVVACAEEGEPGAANPAATPAGAAAPAGTETAQVMPTLVPTKTPRPDCDPAYPDVCISPSPPDLDCGDIIYRRFKVLPPDPHGFDGDNDGVGCER